MECGECTLCCDIFPVNWLNKPANTACKHCNNGCEIHDSKPSECSDFECAYAQMKKVHISIRPDNCGIIFERLSENIFYGTIDPNRKPSKDGIDQARYLNNSGFSVILYDKEKRNPAVMLGKGHDIDTVYQEFNNHLSKINGNS